MKKLILFSVVFALAAGMTFAQFANGISVNAWGRGAWVPLQFKTNSVDANGDQNDGKEGRPADGGVYTGVGPTWGGGMGGQPRVDFRMTGSSDYVGFKFGATAENNELSGGDDGAHIWVKPFQNDFLKITVGRFSEDTLRGKVGGVEGNGFHAFIGGSKEEDAIFNRLGNNGIYSSGGPFAMLSSTPMQGLFIAALLNANAYSGKAPEVYQHLQLAVGYEIDGIGHARVQWLGGDVGTWDKKAAEKWAKANKGSDTPYPGQPTAGDAARIQAAFAFTGMQGLLVDFGATINMPITYKKDFTGGDVDTQFWGGMNLALGATFRQEAFNVGFRAEADGLGAYSDGRAAKKDTHTQPISIGFNLAPAYDFDFASVGMGFRLAVSNIGGSTYDPIEEKTKDNEAKDGNRGATTTFGFGPFIGKALGNGSVKAGVTFLFPAAYENKDIKSRDSTIITIPIILEYAFF